LSTQAPLPDLLVNLSQHRNSSQKNKGKHLKKQNETLKDKNKFERTEKGNDRGRTVSNLAAKINVSGKSRVRRQTKQTHKMEVEREKLLM